MAVKIKSAQDRVSDAYSAGTEISGDIDCLRCFSDDISIDQPGKHARNGISLLLLPRYSGSIGVSHFFVTFIPWSECHDA